MLTAMAVQPLHEFGPATPGDDPAALGFALALAAQWAGAAGIVWAGEHGVFAEIGALAERRIAMLIDDSLSQLPAFLVRHGGLNSGFMIAQVTAAALASENKSLAHPASVDSLPTSANQEDHVSMATFAARRLGPMAENTRGVLAKFWKNASSASFGAVLDRYDE